MVLLKGKCFSDLFLRYQFIFHVKNIASGLVENAANVAYCNSANQVGLVRFCNLACKLARWASANPYNM